jgi:hypothetical protein
MAKAGYVCSLKVTGEPITLLDEAASTSDDQTYTITDALKRVLDPDADITVEDGGVTVTSGYTINRLKGTVTFDTVSAGRVITLSGKYLPVMEVAEASEFSYSLEADNQTKPTFNNMWQKRIQGLLDFSAELTQWYVTNFTVFNDALQDGRILLVEFSIDGEVDIRAWALPASDEVSASVDGVVEESLELEGTQDKEGRTVAI